MLPPNILLFILLLRHAFPTRGYTIPLGSVLDTPKIDTHSHIYPDFHRDAIIAAGYSNGPDDTGYLPTWNVSSHLDFMEMLNISHSYLSITSPGTSLYADESRLDLNVDLTRQGNYYFASLPLPSIPATLAEISRLSSLDTNHAPSGYLFLSNAHSLYLGSPLLAPVYDILNAQSAIIFIHPTSPCPSHAPLSSLSGDAGLPYLNPLLPAGYVPPIIEFLFDSTRTVIDFLVSGTIERYPDITWIVPHAGAALPSLLDRAIRTSVNLKPSNISGASSPLVDPAERRTFRLYPADHIKALLNEHFYFDVEGFSMAHQVGHILEWVGPDRLAYGSDVPFVKWAVAAGLWEEMRDALPDLVGWKGVEGVLRGNLERPFSRRR